jgi:hypothetical protein
MSSLGQVRAIQANVILSWKGLSGITTFVSEEIIALTPRGGKLRRFLLAQGSRPPKSSEKVQYNKRPLEMNEVSVTENKLLRSYR